MEISYTSGNGKHKKLLIFQKVTFQARKIKRTYSSKIPYISGNGTFYPPKNLFIGC